MVQVAKIDKRNVYALPYGKAKKPKEGRLFYDASRFHRFVDDGRLLFTRASLAYGEEDFTKCSIYLADIEELLGFLKDEVAMLNVHQKGPRKT